MRIYTSFAMFFVIFITSLAIALDTQTEQKELSGKSEQIKNSEENNGDLTIVIKGLENSKGSIQIALYNSEKSYNDEK